jgi:hypothetical protein
MLVTSNDLGGGSGHDVATSRRSQNGCTSKAVWRRPSIVSSPLSPYYAANILAQLKPKHRPAWNQNYNSELSISTH